MKTLLTLLLLTATASAADYPVAFLSAPRTAGFFRTQSLSKQSGPYALPSDAQLVVLHEGVERVLVPSGAVDFSVSHDGQSLLVAKRGDGGVVDLHRIDVASGASVRLTDAANEWSPPESYPDWYPAFRPPVWNCQPVETADGIVFLSNRDGWKSPKEDYPAFVLYRMDRDGKNVERIGHMNLGGVFGLWIGPNGRVYFSSGETQGFRGDLNWGIWSINPDGTDWQPEISAFLRGGQPLDWPTITSDGTIVVAHYYHGRVYGTLMAAPRFESTPFGPPTMFGDPLPANNPNIPVGYNQTGTGQGYDRFGFQRRGMYSVTPYATNGDYESLNPQGEKTGIYSHPVAAPGNGILTTWTHQSGEIDLGVYRIPDIKTPPQHHSEPLKVVDRSDRHEWMGRPLVPFQSIYGISKPPATAGQTADELPPGSPFAVVGTSSVAWSEIVTFGAVMSEDKRITIDPEAIEYVRIVSFNPTTTFKGFDTQRGTYSPAQLRFPGQFSVNMEGFSSPINERIGFYETLIPVKKYRTAEGVHYGPNPPAGATRIAGPDGAPDASFKAILPADQPWTFELLDAEKRPIPHTRAQTWHQLRPGEKRVDCQGCHAHNKPTPFAFEDTFAASSDYEVLRLSSTKPDLTDITPGTWSDGRQINEADRFGPWADTVEPTVAVELLADRVCIGAHDPQAGIDKASFTVSHNGTDITAEFTEDAEQQIWTLPRPLADGELVATVKDNFGNVTTKRLTLAQAEPPRVVAGVYLGYDGDHLGDLRTTTPDGKLDHHLRISGLKHPISHIEVKAGSGATDFKWSDRAGEESPEFPLGKWWWIKHEPRIPGSPAGVIDLWLSEPTPAAPHTDFRVYVFYSEDINDRDFIVPVAASKPDTSALEAEIAALKAEVTRLLGIIQAVRDAVD